MLSGMELRGGNLMTLDSNMGEGSSTTYMNYYHAGDNYTDLNSTDAVLNIWSYQYPRPMLAFTAVTAFVFAALGTAGNLLTIIALSLQPNLRTTLTAFVVNLAVVELLFCTIILPVSGAQYLWLCTHDNSLLDDRLCVFFALVRFSLTQAELQTILAIALTRCLAICSLYIKNVMDRTYFKVSYISFIWIYSFCSKIPILTGRWARYEFNKRTMECDISTSGHDGTFKKTRMYTEAIIPCTTIFILYILIYLKVKCTSLNLVKFEEKSTESCSKGSVISKKLSGISGRIQNRQIVNRDARVARTIFIIYLVMIICNIPVIIAHKFEHSEPKGDEFEFNLNLFLAYHILYWSQYIVNILVYILVNQQYRKAYIDCISKMFPHFENTKVNKFPWDATLPSQEYGPNVRDRSLSMHEIPSSENKSTSCIPDCIDRGRLKLSHSEPLIKRHEVAGLYEAGSAV